MSPESALQAVVAESAAGHESAAALLARGGTRCAAAAAAVNNALYAPYLQRQEAQVSRPYLDQALVLLQRLDGLLPIW